MQLMISVVSAEEARQAILGGATLLDIKNPAEGSLGAQAPRMIREIKEICPRRIQVSAALGDMPNLPGTAALAALGAASCGVDYVKVGLHGPRSDAEAIGLLREVQDAVRQFSTSVIAAAYADHHRAGTLDPRRLPDIAASSGVQGCLVDTAIKDGRTLLDFIGPGELRSIAMQAHSSGLLFACAGALRRQDLALLETAEVDIAGLRTAVCRDGLRNGPLETDRVRILIETVQKRPSAG
jgi:(5-formylfuran-3-yl)methyl phosphate synthase